MLRPLEVQHAELITEGITHAKLHDVDHVPGVLRCGLLPQLQPSPGLCETDQGLELPRGDGGAVCALTLLAKVKVELLQNENMAIYQ